jgi:hypothetical protein
MLMHWVPEVQGVVAVDDEGMFALKESELLSLCFSFG